MPDSKRSAVEATAGGPPPTGRLAILTAFALAASSMPIPFLPDRLLARIRGAVVQDAVTRHGLSLTTEARAILAEPAAERALVRKAAEMLTVEILRRLSRLGALTATVRGLEVYALGHLLDRYIARRAAGSVRIDADEARRIRGAVDRAARRALSPSLRPSTTVVPGATEDLRDEFTRWVDAALLTGAALPSYLQRRLEAAFDEIARAEGLHG